MTKSISLIAILALAISPIWAQQQSTITVRGSYEINLSPDEIIVGIDYQEYFLNENEENEQKIKIEEIEERVLKAIKSTGLPDKKITIGGARIVRPYDRGKYRKRRIKKSLQVCVTTSDEFLTLTRAVESAGLFENEVVGFDIDQFRNTERAKFETECRSKAFDDAKAKAELILSTSGQTVGKAITVREINPSSSSVEVFDASTYEVVTVDDGPASGFAPLVVSCKVEVVFELR